MQADAGNERVASRAAFIARVSEKEEDTKAIHFSLSNLVDFREQQVVHTADRPLADGKRKRPNYNSRKRKFMRVQPPERRQ